MNDALLMKEDRRIQNRPHLLSQVYHGRYG